jgi:hypothetical protein
MRYFIDTEFNDNGSPIDLISVGAVADNGKEWYGIIEGYSHFEPYRKSSTSLKERYPEIHSCNAWVKDNVLPNLKSHKRGDDDDYAITQIIGSDDDLRYGLTNFVGNDPYPEFWAFYGHYDWLLVTQLWGGFMKLPKNWPFTCYDINQFARHVGVHHSLPAKFTPEHNALVDARWTKHAFDYVNGVSSRERKWP